MKRFFMYVTLVFAIGASGPKANNRINNPSNPKQIPDSIVVTANRKATPVKEIGSSVTIITETDIQKSQESSVAEILRTVPGLDVVQSGGAGKATSVFMRGANSHHTLVIIDGIEMNDPSSPNGAFDFAHLNSGNIQRIEILRGSQSVLYGSDAIGGVIHIFSKRGFGQPSLSFQSEAGSYSSFHESAIISGSNDKIDYSVFLSRKDSDGFSATIDTLGTEENDGYENSEVAAHLGYNLSDKYELNVIGKYLDARADIDNGWGILEDPNYINQTITKNISLQLNKFDTDDFWTPSVKFLYLNNEYEAINETDMDHPDDASTFNSTGTKIKITGLNHFNINENNMLSIGVESEVEKFNSDFSSESAWGPYAETIDEKENRISSVYALEEISINNTWFNTLGVRYDYHDEFKEAITYRVTSAYLIEEANLKIKGSYSTGFKSPSLFQLFHEFYGNKNLEPEESKSWEAGFDKSFEYFTTGLIYFHNDFSDLIGNDEFFRPINIAKTSSQGLELRAAYRLDKLSISFDYTYTKNKNISDTTAIIRRPKNKFSLVTNYSLNEKINLNLRVTHIGQRYDISSVVLDNYTLANLNMSYAVYSNFSITGKIINLFDKNYQEISGYRTSSRAGYLAFKVKI